MTQRRAIRAAWAACSSSTRRESIRPVQVAMTYFQDENVTNYGLLMAAAFLVTVPIILLYLVAQRRFIEGVAASGLKG